METEFPKSTNKYLKASLFQDQEIPLTYLGWEKKANEDRTKNGQVVSTWKQNLKYQLRYSYPEWALDEAQEKMLGKDGQPFKNQYWDPAFPHGYSIIYHFEEGQLESGSKPLFEAFCMVRPSKGDFVTINRTGEEKETKWKVRKVSKEGIHATMNQKSGELPDIQLEDGEESPF